MDTPQPAQPPVQPPTKGYGKRPLWQWFIIYVIVGAIVYGAIYYFAYANKDASSNGNQNTSRSIY